MSERYGFRKLNMSGLGPGCVKSPSFKLRVEYLSQFRRCGNRLHWQLLSEDDNRENNSVRPWLTHVFTQPGSKTEVSGLARHVRLTLKSGRHLLVLSVSQFVKVCGCRPMMVVPRTPGPAYANLQWRCYGAGVGEDIASVDVNVNRWRATPCRS
jgi:hypothetical protein